MKGPHFWNTRLFSSGQGRGEEGGSLSDKLIVSMVWAQSLLPIKFHPGGLLLMITLDSGKMSKTFSALELPDGTARPTNTMARHQTHRLPDSIGQEGITHIHSERRVGGSAGDASSFGSGHDLTVRGLEPRVGLWADSSEPGAGFGFGVSLPLSAPPPLVLALLKNK